MGDGRAARRTVHHRLDHARHAPHHAARRTGEPAFLAGHRGPGGNRGASPVARRHRRARASREPAEVAASGRGGLAHGPLCAAVRACPQRLGLRLKSRSRRDSFRPRNGPGHLRQRIGIGQAIGHLHSPLTWILLTALGLHIAAALAHGLIWRDGVMSRMLPRLGRGRRPTEPEARWPGRLLDLGFLEDDVLARDGIELLQLELVGLRPRVLLGDVEKPRIGAADQLDEDSAGFCHRRPRGVWNLMRPER